MSNAISEEVRAYLAALGAKGGAKGGRKGGRARTRAKIAAARRNGKLGGRPRKVIAETQEPVFALPVEEPKTGTLAEPVNGAKLDAARRALYAMLWSVKGQESDVVRNLKPVLEKVYRGKIASVKFMPRRTQAKIHEAAREYLLPIVQQVAEQHGLNDEEARSLLMDNLDENNYFGTDCAKLAADRAWEFGKTLKEIIG